jgi:hypothetical protein
VVKKLPRVPQNVMVQRPVTPRAGAVLRTGLGRFPERYLTQSGFLELHMS